MTLGLRLSVIGVVSLITSGCMAAVTVERVDYHGWPHAWRMTNGTVDLVVVPQIGRIMRYGRVGGPNVLWENAALTGKLPDRLDADWANFGGDKLWPAPQSRWNWPPDKEIDPGVHVVDQLPGGRLRITGKPSARHGIRFIREISLAPTGTEATLANSMENASTAAVDWSVWEVAQVDDPSWAEIPIGPTDAINLFDDPSVGDRGLSIKGSISGGAATVRLTRHPSKSGKIGTRAAGQWARARAGADEILLLGTSEGRGAYPDKGCRQEIYSNADPAKYMELELLSPVIHLKPGARTTFLTRWRLEPTKGD